MATNKDRAGTTRCVYVIPDALHQRIVQFQENMGLPSEAEAARRLLDLGLNHGDCWQDIAKRVKDELLDGKTIRQAAQSTLAGHPLVRVIEFGDHHVTFSLTTGEAVTVRPDGEWHAVTPGKSLGPEAA